MSNLWNFISAGWGFLVPVLIEVFTKKISGWKKVTLVIVCCLISGVVTVMVKDAGQVSFKDIGSMFQSFIIILIASQGAWAATWYKVFNK